MSTEQEKFGNDTKAAGAWKRNPTKFHNSIEEGTKYPPVSGRYRLYVSYACPWAHRCLITRKLKGLEDIIALTVTDYEMPFIAFSVEQSSKYKGWMFNTREGLHDKNEVNNVFYEPHGFKTMSELYELAHPGYREEYIKSNKRPVYSVPVLFDEETQTIVTNESSEIIVLFNEKFNKIAGNSDLDLNPKELQQKMEEVNAVVYPKINDGVYRCGFAKTQKAYEDAYNTHWEGMDEIEALLGKNKFLTGDKFTLSDIRLFVTLIRYDSVYYAHFKTSRNKIQDLPNMFRFLKEIYNIPGVKETVSNEHIVKHYYGSQGTVNPTGIWPLGPLSDNALDYLLK